MQQAAQALELTPREVVTLAALVEKETAQPSERPDRRGGVLESAEDRHGDAGGPDRDLRASTGRTLQRQYPSR
jgi:hypothetical protein